MRSVILCMVVGASVAAFSVSAEADPGTFRPLFHPRAIEFGLSFTHTPLRQIECADLDGDGDQDVVGVVNPNTGFSVCWNQGGFGALTTPELIETDTNVEALSTGDVDGDADVDVVLANTNSLAVLRNTGDGTFAPPEVYPTSGEHRGVELRDLDNDGDLDTLAWGPGIGPGSLIIRRNAGDGTFGAEFGYWGGGGVDAVATGDVDGDGDVDIVTTSYREIRVFRNRGGGYFHINADIYATPSWTYVSSLVLADCDHEGSLDIVASIEREGDDGVFALRNYGNGVFQPAVNLPSGHDGSISAADLDADGWPELVICDGREVTVLDPRAGFVFVRTQTFKTAIGHHARPQGVAPADIDGDGDTDILAMGEEWAAVFLNDGAGRIQNAPVSAELDRAGVLATGDLDGDGDRDLVHAGGNVQVCVNDGAGGLHIAQTIAGPGATCAVLADLDGDHRLDLIKVGDHPGVDVLFNNGTGVFGPPVRKPGGPGHGIWVVAGDVDEDGDIDICSFDDDDVGSVLRNRGDGTFEAPDWFGTGDWPSRARLRDLNADDLPEVVVINGRDGTIHVRENLGAGAFGLPQVLDTRTGLSGSPLLQGLACGDLDGDGDVDIAAAGFVGLWSGIHIFWNAGDGTFQEQSRFPGAFGPIALGDIDGDSDLDLVGARISGSIGAEAAVFQLNNGDGTFAPRSCLAMGSLSNDVVLAPMDDDFDLDLIVSTSDGIVMLPNATGLAPNIRPLCPADIDGEGFVSAGDFNILAAHFGEPVSPHTLGDLNGDGLVAIADFVLFAADFGRSCP